MARPSPNFAGCHELVSLGNAIRAARTTREFSQEALAHDLGMDRSYVGGVERGEHNVTIMNLVRIAAQLDLKVSDLFKLAGL